MSWLYSQALVEELLGDTSSDGEQSALLSGNPIPQAYCAPDKMTAFSRLSRFGMTFKPLTASRGKELLTLYLEDFHAKTSAPLGGGAGIDGERSGMWREMARIIHEVRPQFVFVENSPMLTSRGLGTVLGDLASMGFDAKWGVLGAADVGANHQRNRIWIVATSNTNSIINALRGDSQDHAESMGEWRVHARGSFSSSRKGCEEVTGQSTNVAYANSAGLGTGGWEGFHIKREKGVIAAPSNTTVAQPECKGLEGQRSQPGEQEIAESGNSSALAYSTGSRSQRGNKCRCNEQGSSKRFQPELAGTYGSNIRWWETEPNVGRVADGVAARVDRLKAIGNGQVPLCAATAWRLLN